MQGPEIFRPPPLCIGTCSVNPTLGGEIRSSFCWSVFGVFRKLILVGQAGHFRACHGWGQGGSVNQAVVLGRVACGGIGRWMLLRSGRQVLAVDAAGWSGGGGGCQVLGRRP